MIHKCKGITEDTAVWKSGLCGLMRCFTHYSSKETGPWVSDAGGLQDLVRVEKWFLASSIRLYSIFCKSHSGGVLCSLNENNIYFLCFGPLITETVDRRWFLLQLICSMKNIYKSVMFSEYKHVFYLIRDSYSTRHLEDNIEETKPSIFCLNKGEFNPYWKNVKRESGS